MRCRQVARRVIENGYAACWLGVGIEQQLGSDVDQGRTHFRLRLVLRQMQLRCCAAGDGRCQRDHIGLVLLRQQGQYRILPHARLASVARLGQGGMREASIGDEVSGQRHDRDQGFPRRKIVAVSA